MILSALIALFVVVMSSVIGLFPTYSGLPSGMSSALTTVTGAIGGVLDFFPKSTLISVVSLLVSIELAIWGFHVVAWLFHWRQK